MKQAENFRVRELVKKIESHPHRHALHAYLQQNNAYNPFSDESKAMIREMGHIELFELCETVPKVQCSECFLHWNQGMNLLKECESSQSFHQWQLNAFSIPHYVIKKSGDFVVLGTAKLRQERVSRGPQRAEEMYQK